MKKSLSLGAPLLVLALMGFGCNPFASVQEKINQKIGDAVTDKVLEAATGEKVNLDTADGSVSIKGKDGTSSVIGTNVTIPAGFTDEIPRYKGSSVNLASVDKDGRSVLFVEIKDASIKDLTAWYEEQIIAKGYKKTSTNEVTEYYMAEFAKGDAGIGLLLVSQKDGDKETVTAQITYSPKGN